MSWKNITSGERRTKLFLNLHPKPDAGSELKVRTKEDMGQFSADPINKAVPSFRNSLTEYAKCDGRHSEHFCLLKKCSHFARSCTVEKNFDNVTTARLP